jgi:hypothetical protein
MMAAAASFAGRPTAGFFLLAKMLTGLGRIHHSQIARRPARPSNWNWRSDAVSATGNGEGRALQDLAALTYMTGHHGEAMELHDQPIVALHRYQEITALLDNGRNLLPTRSAH